MNFVVFGSSGFIGCRLCDYLLKHGHNVFAIYHKNRNINIGPYVHLYSLTEFKNISAPIDAVFFMPGSFASSQQELIQINCNLLQEVSNHFHQSKLVYISSVEVYGHNKNAIDESSCFNNPSYYGLSKIAGEFISRNHPSFAILRLCYIYGPHINNNSFIPNIIKQAIKENKVTIYGKGERMQDYLYLDDAVELCFISSQCNDNDVFIGATGRSISNKTIAELVSKIISKATIKYIGNETGNSILINPIKSFKKLNWHPKFTIEEGLKLTIDASIDLW